MTRNFNRNQEKDRFNELAGRLKRGDRAAGEEIFAHFSGQIYGFFMIRLYQREAAEDLTQSVFLKLVGRIETFDVNKGNFSSWLWQIARNTLIDHQREKRSVIYSDDIVNNASVKDETIERTERNEQLERIMKIVKTFTKDEQEIFSLRYLKGASYHELSKRTGKSEGALRVFIHRVTQKLKNALLPETAQ